MEVQLGFIIGGRLRKNIRYEDATELKENARPPKQYSKRKQDKKTDHQYHEDKICSSVRANDQDGSYELKT